MRCQDARVGHFNLYRIIRMINRAQIHFQLVNRKHHGYSWDQIVLRLYYLVWCSCCLPSNSSQISFYTAAIHSWRVGPRPRTCNNITSIYPGKKYPHLYSNHSNKHTIAWLFVTIQCLDRLDNKYSVPWLQSVLSVLSFPIVQKLLLKQFPLLDILAVNIQVNRGKRREWNKMCCNKT